MSLFCHLCTKFGEKIDKRQIYAKNEIEDGGRRHLEFISGGYFNILSTSYYRCQTPYKISCK